MNCNEAGGCIFSNCDDKVVKCPRCEKEMRLVCTWRKRGAVIGGLSGAALAYSGARAGASAGSCILPGLGTLIGTVTGALLGAAAGAAIGELVDREVVAHYKCGCGCTCNLNE